MFQFLWLDFSFCGVILCFCLLNFMFLFLLLDAPVASSFLFSEIYLFMFNEIDTCLCLMKSMLVYVPICFKLLGFLASRLRIMRLWFMFLYASSYWFWFLFASIFCSKYEIVYAKYAEIRSTCSYNIAFSSNLRNNNNGQIIMGGR